MKLRVAIGISLIMWSSLAIAQTNPAASPACLPMPMLWAEFGESIHRSADAAKLALGMMERQQAILGKYKLPPDRPVGESLTMSDSAQFTKIGAQIHSNHLYSLAESRLQRDVVIVDKLLNAAQAMSRGASLPSEADPGFLYFAIVVVARDSMKGVNRPTPAPSSTCSPDLAFSNLSKMEAQASVRLVMETPDYLQLLGIRAKYGVKENATLDPTKASQADGTRYAALEQSTVRNFQAVTQYLDDIDNIAAFAEMSQIRYQMIHQQLLEIGPSEDAEETARWYDGQYQKLTPAQQAMWPIWQLINERVLSDTAKRDLEIQAALQELEHP